MELSQLPNLALGRFVRGMGVLGLELSMSAVRNAPKQLSFKLAVIVEPGLVVAGARLNEGRSTSDAGG